MEIAAIQRRIETIENLEKEIRTTKEMLKAELENEPEYLKTTGEAKEAAAKKKMLREEILTRGTNQKMVDDIKANTEEMKTLKEILSAELMEVYQKDKTDMIPDAYGHTRKFKILVKLLPERAASKERYDAPAAVNLDK